VRLHVEAAGPEDGAPVVFLHGVSGSMRTYAWLTGAITEGRRIVRVDLRGHGRSEHAPGTYDIDRYSEDVVEVLRETVGRPAVLVGHSLGGVVAWWVAQRHPELVAAAFLEDPPLYMGEPAEHRENPAIPYFAMLRDTAVRWQSAGTPEADAAAELERLDAEGRSAQDAYASRAFALTHLDPRVLDALIDGTLFAAVDTRSPMEVRAFILAAGEMPAFPPRHEERLAMSHGDVVVGRVPGARHVIHDERAHRDEYVRALVERL
jgi:pimeloyl-ACP methyl ester carboxylesterase